MLSLLLIVALYCCTVVVTNSAFKFDDIELTIDDENEVRLSYTSDSTDPALHYKMGYIALLRQEPNWMSYFIAGLSISEQAITDYRSFLQLCTTDADIDGAIAWLTDMTSIDAQFYDLLIDFTWSRNRYVDYYVSLMSACLAYANHYPFWLKFTNFLAMLNNPSSDVYRYLHRIVHKPLLDRLILIGLSLYPRDSNLLMHQALSYVDAEEFQCAAHILNRAVSFNSSISSSIELNSWLSTVDKLQTLNSTWADVHCFPFAVHTTAMHHQYTSGLWEGLPPVQPGQLLSIFHIPDFLTQPYQPRGQSRPSVNLQVGCSKWSRCVRQGWLIADAVDVPSTHFVTLAYNLSMIESGSILNLYSSHTLEHLSHYTPLEESNTGMSEICMALKEWNRVLVPGGMLFVGVPNAEAMFELFLNSNDEVRGIILKILFGGQDTPVNVHRYGFYFNKLSSLLEANGFCDVHTVQYFDLFDDTSQTTLAGVPISLNVVAQKCSESIVDNNNEHGPRCLL